MGDVREALVEVLHRHGYSHRFHCQCGESLPADGPYLAEHQADAVFGVVAARLQERDARSSGQTELASNSSDLAAAEAAIERVRREVAEEIAQAIEAWGGGRPNVASWQSTAARIARAAAEDTEDTP